MIWLKEDGFDEEIIMSVTFGERIYRRSITAAKRCVVGPARDNIYDE